MDISKLLLKAIKESGISRYRISKDTGIDAAALSRFVNGKRGIDLGTAEKLLKYFGFEITLKKPKTKE